MDPGRSPLASGVWSALDWFAAFKRAWCAAKGEDRYLERGRSDLDALRRLDEGIRAIQPKACLAAQARAGATFDMFLGETGKAEENVHCFAFYVARWNDYRVRAKPPTPAAGTRSWDYDTELEPLPPPGRPR